MINNFVALDFETSFGHIPCSIGIVEFINGEIVNSYYRLIKPIELKFSEINSRINGIKLEDVINEHEFKDIWCEIEHYINNRVIVCHNSTFDLNVLTKTLKYYDIIEPKYTSFCTLDISRKTYDFESYKLSFLAEHFNIPQSNYHNALEDALVCGKIFYLIYESYIKNENKSTNNNSKTIRSVNNIVEKTYIKWNKTNVLNGKKVVVSGIFNSFTRESIKLAIIDNGGIVVNSISKSTHLLISGLNMGPSKKQKALEYNITILDENDFIALILDIV